MGKISSPLLFDLLYGLMPLKEVITDMNNKTKLYKDENGDCWYFDFSKFISITKTNARAEENTQEDYLRKLAKILSCSYDTLLGWKKRKNAPQDLELVHSLENALGLPFNSLLYSKEKQLENELKKAKNENTDLVRENFSLKRKLEQVELNDDNSESINNSAEERFSFSEQTNSFSLKYDGFSNLIDLLIGMSVEENAIEDSSCTYAEELSYILSDYIYNYTLAELIGFGGKRSNEEFKSFMNELKKDTNDSDEAEEKNDRVLQWINEAIIDSNGNRLYGEKGEIKLKGIELFERLRNSSFFNKSDSLRIKTLTGDLIRKWNSYFFPYATISISLMLDDIVVDRYSFGDGFVHPTNDDRMEIINQLLFLNNGDISKYSLQNTKIFHVDQFEREIEIAFDLKDLI